MRWQLRHRHASWSLSMVLKETFSFTLSSHHFDLNYSRTQIECSALKTDTVNSSNATSAKQTQAFCHICGFYLFASFYPGFQRFKKELWLYSTFAVVSWTVPHSATGMSCAFGNRTDRFDKQPFWFIWVQHHKTLSISHMLLYHKPLMCDLRHCLGTWKSHLHGGFLQRYISMAS